MKRFLALCLSLCLLLPLIACGDKPAEPAPQPEPAPTVTEPEPAPAEPTPAEPTPAEPAPEPEPEPEPAEPKLYTKEQIQQAVCQTALAYYYHDPAVQYQTTGGSMVEPFACRATDSSFMADDAEADDYVYSVCSDFGWRVYKEATGWTYSKTSAGFVTNIVSGLAVDDPLVVYKFRGPDGETDVEKAIAESHAALEPGDLITYYVKSGAGHMMVYVGDLFGDGKEYILHCDSTGGGNTDYTTGYNPIEPNGSIQKETTEQIVFNKSDRYIFSSGVTQFTIVRPTNILLDENGMGTLTPAAETRLANPYMEIHKTFDRSIYDGVQNGETMTCTVKITNNGKDAYTGLSVTEPVPEGQTFVSATNSGALRDGNVCWTLDLAAGKTAELTYTVKVSGKPGDSVVFARGTVNDIPTRTAEFQICGKPLSKEQTERLNYIIAGSLPEGLAFDDLNTVNTFYKDVFGIDPKLPATFSDFVTALTSRKSYYGVENKVMIWKEKNKLDADALTLRNMVLHKHLYGRYAYDGTDAATRVLEFLEDRYQPGDVFVNVYGGSSSMVLSTAHINIQIYLGSGKVLVLTENGISVQSFAESIGLNLRQDFGFALRPTLAYDDISTSNHVEPKELASASASDPAPKSDPVVETFFSLLKTRTASTATLSRGNGWEEIPTAATITLDGTDGKTLADANTGRQYLYELHDGVIVKMTGLLGTQGYISYVSNDTNGFFTVTNLKKNEDGSFTFDLVNPVKGNASGLTLPADALTFDMDGKAFTVQEGDIIGTAVTKEAPNICVMLRMNVRRS